MKNSELDSLLKSSAGLSRSEEYWREFPSRVMDELRLRGAEADRKVRPAVWADRALGWRLSVFQLRSATALALAMLCLGLAFGIGFWRGRHSSSIDPQMAEAQKCFREIQGLFPNQLQAIILDPQGAQLILADRPNLPSEPPLYLKICDANGCRRFVTFSGQQIRVNGDVFDVLVNRQGEVLVVGQQWVWSSSQPAEKAGRYRIEARPLPAA